MKQLWKLAITGSSYYSTNGRMNVGDTIVANGPALVRVQGGRRNKDQD